MKKFGSLTLIGKRWFQRGPGNTYHSVIIYADGNCLHKVDYRYGYGDQWIYSARDWLDANGYLPGIKKKEGTPGEALWRYCERVGITLVYNVTDVPRKRDL